MAYLKGNSRGVDEENVRMARHRGMSEAAAVKRMVSLKQSPKKSEKVTAAPSMGEDYPYGTRIDLNDEALNKLGITALPKAGSSITLNAKGQIASTSENTEQSGKHRRSVCIQLTHMSLKK